MQVQHLAWDSAFFGYSVAKISLGLNDQEHRDQRLTLALEKLQSDGHRLVYCSSPIPLSNQQADTFKGQLVDKKTSYKLDLSQSDRLGVEDYESVEVYPADEAPSVLNALAILSGKYSRFKMDTRIKQSQFEALYKQWVSQSVNRLMADEVLVIKGKQNPLGFISVTNKATYAEIGLLAVADKASGQGYGQQLVTATKRWAQQQSLQRMQVVTQGDNTPACRLYEKCGFELSELEYYYHFWL